MFNSLVWFLEGGVTDQYDTKWVGWPGFDVYNEVEKTALSESLAHMVCIDPKISTCIFIFVCRLFINETYTYFHVIRVKNS